MAACAGLDQPDLQKGLTVDGLAASEAFDQRVTQRFPLGISEIDLVKALRAEGVKIENNAKDAGLIASIPTQRGIDVNTYRPGVYVESDGGLFGVTRLRHVRTREPEPYSRIGRATYEWSAVCNYRSQIRWRSNAQGEVVEMDTRYDGPPCRAIWP